MFVVPSDPQCRTGFSCSLACSFRLSSSHSTPLPPCWWSLADPSLLPYLLIPPLPHLLLQVPPPPPPTPHLSCGVPVDHCSTYNDVVPKYQESTSSDPDPCPIHRHLIPSPCYTYPATWLPNVAPVVQLCFVLRELVSLPGGIRLLLVTSSPCCLEPSACCPDSFLRCCHRCLLLRTSLAANVYP